MVCSDGIPAVSRNRKLTGFRSVEQNGGTLLEFCCEACRGRKLDFNSVCWNRKLSFESISPNAAAENFKNS
jgi:hypothetical protein